MKDLDRNVAIHVGLLSLVDCAHSPFSDLLDDTEMASYYFAEVRVAHDVARVASELGGREESASRTRTIHVASAINR